MVMLWNFQNYGCTYKHFFSSDTNSSDWNRTKLNVSRFRVNKLFSCAHNEHFRVALKVKPSDET